jgi:hypothetical protein
MLVGQLAFMIAAVFTGAAIYINIAEQPARLHDRSLLNQWKPAYKRGYIMQASLVVVGGVLGLVSFLRSRVALAPWSRRSARKLALYNLRDDAGHGRLMDTPPEDATAETRQMIRQWGNLHAGRNALGLVATLMFLWAWG